MHPIHVASEKVFEIMGIPISNTIMMSWLVMPILIVVSFCATRKMKMVPSGLQNVMEVIVEGLYGLVQNMMGSAKHAKKVFAYAATIFLFILLNNWMGIVPGMGSIGIYQTPTVHEETGEVPAEANLHEEAPATHEEETAATEGAHEGPELVSLFRPASSDLSFTIAMALLTIIYVQCMGISFAGAGYLKKFFNFSHPIKFFVGILEIVSEFSRIISLAFRLFGNIFAGKVLLIVMIFLVPYIVPIPFYGIEVFVGAVQALVFFILTLVFLRGAAEAHH